MATAIDVADALVAALNGSEGPKYGTPPAGLNAARAYRPVYDLKDMKDLRVTVVPKAVEIELAGRNLAQKDVQIDVAVQKKLSGSDSGGNPEIDALMDLVEEVADFVRSAGRLAGAVWIKTENAPIYSPDHMENLRQFTSVLTFTFRLVAP